MGSHPQAPPGEAEDQPPGGERPHGPLAGKVVAASAIAGVAAAAAGGAMAGGDELIGDADGRTVEELADRAAESILEDVPRLAPVEELVGDVPREPGADRSAGEEAGTFVASTVVESVSDASDATAVALGVGGSDATPVAPSSRGGGDAFERGGGSPRDRGADPAPDRGSSPAAERETPSEDDEEPRGDVLDTPSASGPEAAPDAGDRQPPGETPSSGQEAPGPGSDADQAPPSPGASAPAENGAPGSGGQTGGQTPTSPGSPPAAPSGASSTPAPPASGGAASEGP